LTLIHHRNMSLPSNLYDKAKEASSDFQNLPLWPASTDWFDTPTGQAIKDLLESIQLSLRPAPKAGDGYYDDQVDKRAGQRDRKLAAKVTDALGPYISSISKPSYTAKIVVSSLCGTEESFTKRSECAGSH
jgi:hypothetical protein